MLNSTQKLNPEVKGGMKKRMSLIIILGLLVSGFVAWYMFRTRCSPIGENSYIPEMNLQFYEVSILGKAYECLVEK